MATVTQSGAPTQAPTQAPPYEPNPSFFDIQRSDAGNARRLLEAHGSDIFYNSDRNEWYVWDSKRWVPDPKSRKVAAKMKTVLQELRNESLEIMRELEPTLVAGGDDLTEDQRKTAARYKKAEQDYKWSIASESDRHVSGAVRQAASEAAVKVIRDRDMDADVLLFNLQNGTYDLRTNTLREHRREDLITKIAPVSHDPRVSYKRFAVFLAEIFPNNQGLIDYVQRLLGYCLSGLTTERIVPFFIGSGANGKSVLCNVLLRGIFGNGRDGYGMECNFTTFTTSKYAAPDKPRNDLIRMQGKRFVAASELDDGTARMDTALLKKISGNDDLSVRANFSQEIEFLPQAKVFLRMNNEPRILDDTDSTWDRVKKIIFPRQFQEDERDIHLTEALLAEASGVLNWLLEGWQLVQDAWQNCEVALPEPAEVKMATQEYRQTQSQVARFFTENYRIADRECEPIPVSDIYRDYVVWTGAQGETFKKTLTAFGLELTRYLTPYKTVSKKTHPKKRTICWAGIEPIPVEATTDKASQSDSGDLPF